MTVPKLLTSAVYNIQYSVLKKNTKPCIQYTCKQSLLPSVCIYIHTSHTGTVNTSPETLETKRDFLAFLKMSQISNHVTILIAE